MIPEFNEDGVLPMGIHPSTIKEFTDRFAYTFIRKKLLNGLLKLMEDLKRIDCKAIYVDGSYVTNKRVPGDVDVCWENIGVDLVKAKLTMPILWDLDPPRHAQQTKYNCDIFPAHIPEGISGLHFLEFFQIDKNTNLPKGIIQINII